MTDIRDNLKLFIKESGYIKSSIAKKSNLTPSKFSGILNKNRKLDANELFDICKTLNITPDELKNFEKKYSEDY